MSKKARQHIWRKRICGSLCWATLLGIAGCGASHELETAPVAGVVTLDGKPLDQALVTLTPQRGRGAVGSTQQDGSFILTTYQSGDGATIGEHKITVSPRKKVTIGREGEQSPVSSIIPDRYKSADLSGLSCEVKPGQKNELQLELTSN